MKKGILVLVVSLGILSIGFMFGSVVSNGKREKVEQSYQNKIDSLGVVIEDKDWQIDQLEDGLSERESEISYWGRKYDSLRTKDQIGPNFGPR
jgi:peptidoglycan hydrolase CwlO-like protein